MPDTNPKTQRITATFELFHYKILQKLDGSFSTSLSGVVNDIVKYWINEHLGDLKNNYGIDVVGIRREIQMLTLKDNLEDKIQEIKGYLETSKKVKIEDLVTGVEINRSMLLKLIKDHSEELNAVIDGDYISPK